MARPCRVAESREGGGGGAPLFDEFLSVDPERLVERDHFRDAARCLADFDVTFSPVVSRSNGADKLIGASAAPAFGTTGENSNILPWDKRTNDRFYARLVAADPKSHETENHAAFLEHLGIDVGPAVGMPRWRVPREAKALVLDGLRQRLGLELGECFIAVSPFSKMRLKEWPEASWHAVLDALAAKLPDMSIFLLGTELDREAHGGFVRALAARPEVVDLTGKTSLVETTVLLSEATLAVSVDTAAPHIASAVGTPSIVILGGGHYGRFFPLRLAVARGPQCLPHPSHGLLPLRLAMQISAGQSARAALYRAHHTRERGGRSPGDCLAQTKCDAAGLTDKVLCVSLTQAPLRLADSFVWWASHGDRRAETTHTPPVNVNVAWNTWIVDLDRDKRMDILSRSPRVRATRHAGGEGWTADGARLCIRRRREGHRPAEVTAAVSRCLLGRCRSSDPSVTRSTSPRVFSRSCRPPVWPGWRWFRVCSGRRRGRVRVCRG